MQHPWRYKAIARTVAAITVSAAVSAVTAVRVLAPRPDCAFRLAAQAARPMPRLSRRGWRGRFSHIVDLGGENKLVLLKGAASAPDAFTTERVLGESGAVTLNKTLWQRRLATNMWVLSR